MMTTFDQNYKTIRRLGEGGFGVVYLVKRKVDGQVCSNSRPQEGIISTTLTRSRTLNSARIADTTSLLRPYLFV